MPKLSSWTRLACVGFALDHRNDNPPSQLQCVTPCSVWNLRQLVRCKGVEASPQPSVDSIWFAHVWEVPFPRLLYACPAGEANTSPQALTPNSTNVLFWWVTVGGRHLGIAQKLQLQPGSAHGRHLASTPKILEMNSMSSRSMSLTTMILASQDQPSTVNAFGQGRAGFPPWHKRPMRGL